MMPPNASRVARLSIRASAARPYKREGVAVIHRSDIAALNQSINQSIEPKIRQNEQERTASMSAAAKCIVGGHR